MVKIIVVFTKTEFYPKDFGLDSKGTNKWNDKYPFYWIDPIQKGRVFHGNPRDKDEDYLSIVKSSGVLLVNDGWPFQSVDIELVIRCLKQSIDPGKVKIYLNYHKNSKNAYGIEESMHTIWPMNKIPSITSSHSRNEKSVIYYWLEKYYRNEVTLDHIIRIVFEQKEELIKSERALKRWVENRDIDNNLFQDTYTQRGHVSGKKSKSAKIILICSAWCKDVLENDLKRAWFNTKEKKKSISCEVVVISSREEFSTLNLIKIKPEYAFIQAELGWDRKTALEGYLVARELIAMEDCQLLNLQFIARYDLKDKINDETFFQAGFAKNFRHWRLNTRLSKHPLSIDFADEWKYESTHFEFIKVFRLERPGIISTIDHDLSPFLRLSDDTLQSEEKQKRLRRLVRETNDLIEGYDLFNITQPVQVTEINKILVEKLVVSVEKIKYHFSDSYESDSLVKKRKQKVYILEDEPDYRKLLHGLFSEEFEHVYPTNLIENQYNLMSEIAHLKENISNYDIVIMDLMYEDRDGFLLPTNGLELYENLSKKNPFAVFRIVTSLPRQKLGDLSSKLKWADLSVGQIFTKREGEEYLAYAIKTRIEELVLECDEKLNEKMQCDKLLDKGWFKSIEVRHWMITHQQEVKKHIDCARAVLSRFQECKSLSDLILWGDGKISRNKKGIELTADYIQKKLPRVLAHRLLVIDYVLSRGRVIQEEFEDLVLKKLNLGRRADRVNYFFNLGFQVEKERVNEQGERSMDVSWGQLFEHEQEMIKTYRPYSLSNRVVLGFYKEVFNIPGVVENWDSLGLNFTVADALKNSDEHYLIELIQNLPELADDDYTGIDLKMDVEILWDKVHESDNNLPKSIKNWVKGVSNNNV